MRWPRSRRPRGSSGVAAIRGRRGWLLLFVHRGARVRRRGIIVGDVAAISRLAEFERHAVGCSATNHKLSEMNRFVVKLAQGEDVSEIVTAALALKLDMVEIESDITAASGDGAAMAISG